MLAAEVDLQPDLGVDLLTQELPLGTEFDESRVPCPGPLLGGNHDFLRVANVQPDQRGFQTLKQAPPAHDHRDFEVHFLLIELALFLRDLIVGRVEEGLGPVWIHGPGVVFDPDDVSFLNRFRRHRLTPGWPWKRCFRLKVAGPWRGIDDVEGAPIESTGRHFTIPMATEIRLYRFRIVTSVTPATSATSFCVHGLLQRIAEM